MKRDKTAHRRRAGSTAGDGFVLVAMAVVAAAIGSGVYLHLGASKGVGVGFALATYLLLYKLHRLRASSQKARSLDAEVRRLEGELDKTRVNAADVTNVQPVTASVQPGPTVGTSTPAPPQAPVMANATALPPRPSHYAAAQAGPAAGQQLPSTVPGRASARQDDATGELGLSALKDFWAYRPSDPVPGPALRVPPTPTPTPTQRQPVSQSPPQGIGAVSARVPAPSRVPAVEQISSEAPSAALRESDVEMIQGLIKRLADEVNAADASLASVSSTPHVQDASFATPTAHGPAAAPAIPARPAEAVEASLDALRITADTMREAAARSAGVKLSELRIGRPETDPVFASNAPMPPPVRPGHYKLAAIADAVHSGRIEVLLEPVMGLGDLRARHYEVSIRLYDPTGSAIEAAPADPSLAGSNLLPLLDRTRFDRVTSVARRLSERGKTGSIFSEYSGEALSDGEFLKGAAEDPASQLVLTFAQADVRNLSPAQWKGLAGLKELGFRFAVSEVTDLDMDFERLAAAGFDFVKLDAAVFLDGLKGPHGTIPSGDICGYLARMGFTLVANRIDSEYERSRLYGFGVLFGQGQLFGGARPMKADALSGAKNAAA